VRTPPPWCTVIVWLPATVPEKVTTPLAAARTGVPSATPTSIPQWPPNRPSGANRRTTGPSAGGPSRQETETRETTRGNIEEPTQRIA